MTLAVIARLQRQSTRLGRNHVHFIRNPTHPQHNLTPKHPHSTTHPTHTTCNTSRPPTHLANHITTTNCHNTTLENDCHSSIVLPRFSFNYFNSNVVQFW